MNNQKYINDNGIVSFNGYMGKAPMSVDATVSALNAMNLLCEGYESQIAKLAEQNKMLREALEALIQGYDCEEVAHNFGIDQETAYKAVSALIDTEDAKC